MERARGRAGAAELAGRCDLVIAGEDEAVLLCGSAEASALAECFGVEAVVKLGARGAVACRGGELAQDAASRWLPWTSSARAMRSRPATSTRCWTAPADRGAAPCERLRRDRRLRCRRRHRAAHARRARAGAGRRRRRRPLASARREGRIVGGGVVGLCSAYALTRAGAEVVLLERAGSAAARPRATRAGSRPRSRRRWQLPACSATRPALGLRSARRARHPAGPRHGLAALAVGL